MLTSPVAAGLEETDIAVRPELRDVVDSIAELRAIGPRYISLPRGSVQILIRRDGAYVTGPYLRVRRKPADRHPVVAVRIAPGAAPALFGVAATELADRVVALSELWRAPAGDIQDLLAHRLRAAGPDRATTRAARLLDADPTLRIDQLARELGLGERQLRRRFAAAVGMSPKRYARAARIRRAIALVRPNRSWAAIAVAAGFYDQAHMIAEFHAIAGATPETLVAELRCT
jgi:AraC-like DNA-binding protein